jgi:PAS domain S-box-containing protein
MNAKLNRSEASNVRFPWWSLTGVLILTVGFCVGLVGSALHSYRLNGVTQQRNARLEELRGVILLLDEVLTMSAQMGVAIGEREWEDRYRRSEPQLDPAILEARRLQAHKDILRTAALIDAANLKLVEMEHQAFELVHQGQQGKARAILSSPEYQRQKQDYSDGMSGFMVLVANHLKAMQATGWRQAQLMALANRLKAMQATGWWQAQLTVLGASVGLGLTFWFWIVAICRIHRWRTILVQSMADLTQVDQALRQSQEQLEVRVRERTAALSAEIAERQRVEGDLQASELQFRTISNVAHDAIIVMDHDGRISFWNEAAERIFGHPKSEAVGKDLHDLLAPAIYREKHQQALAHWRETGQGAALGKSLELIALRKNGATFPVELSLSAMQVKGECKALAIVRDITERKRYESELKQARHAAQTSTQAKSEFLASMSHEIRTPMNGVIGMANLLLDTGLTPQQQHFANTIHQSGEALLAIINDILDYSKIEAGKLVFEKLDFDLREAVESALDLVAERASSKHLELAISLPSGIPMQLRGDPGRLRQILLNLVNNAIKFTERGEVIVRVALVSETATHARLRFEVQDTGMGISPEGQARLFQAFSQEDRSIQRKFGGTGLGLTISKQLVELMGGQIGVESEPGKGSTFWFTTAWEKQPVEAVPVRKDEPVLADLCVLIVDDNATNREILEHQTRAWKMRSRGAASPTDALQMLREASAEPYALALLDMLMPEMDGLSLARAIKADPAISSTRLVLLTSLGQKLDSATLKAAGIEACLTKPVRQSQLFDCLAAVMGLALPLTARPLLPPTGAAAPVRPLRILLAEDDLINQQVAVGQLCKLGLTARVVANGLAVLAALDQAFYDVILMDCQMPEMGGLQTTQEIRRREHRQGHRPVHIIAMTAQVMQGDREECLAAGMNDYIRKPVRQVDLQKALDRCDRDESDHGQAAAGLTPRSSAEPVMSPSHVAAGDAPPPTLGAEEPPVDWKRFREITEDSPEEVRQLTELYLSQADCSMKAIQAAIKADAAKNVFQLAHKLWGSSSACGMMAILPPLLELERQGQQGRLTDADQLFAQANRQLESIRHVLADHLLSLQPQKTSDQSSVISYQSSVNRES